MIIFERKTTLTELEWSLSLRAMSPTTQCKLISPLQYLVCFSEKSQITDWRNYKRRRQGKARQRRWWRRWRRRRRIVSDLCLLNNWEESTETILTLYAYVVVCMRVFIFDCCFFLFCASNEKYRTMSNNSHLFKLSSLQFF